MFHKSTKPEAVFFLSENLQFYILEMFVQFVVACKYVSLFFAGEIAFGAA